MQVRIHIFVTAVILVSLSLAGFSSADTKGTEKDTSYVATIGDGGITIDELNSTFEGMREATGSPISVINKQEVLRQLIEQELLYREAVSRDLASETDVKSKIDQAVRAVLVNEIIARNFRDRISPVSTEEAEQYFRDNPSKFNRPAVYSASVFYVNRNDVSGAPSEKSLLIAEDIKSSLLERGTLLDGSGEQELAREFAEKYPDVRIERIPFESYYEGKNSIVPAGIRSRIKALQPGEAGIAEIPSAYAVFMLRVFTPEEQASFEFVKNRIISELEAQQQMKAFRSLIEELTAKYGVSINEGILNK